MVDEYRWTEKVLAKGNPRSGGLPKSIARDVWNKRPAGRDGVTLYGNYLLYDLSALDVLTAPKLTPEERALTEEEIIAIRSAETQLIDDIADVLRGIFPMNNITPPEGLPKAGSMAAIARLLAEQPSMSREETQAISGIEQVANAYEAPYLARGQQTPSAHLLLCGRGILHFARQEAQKAIRNEQGMEVR